jgi:tellurite resistance protein
MSPPKIPAAYFGAVLGLAGLGNAWRVAHQAWGLPVLVGEALELTAVLVWAVLVVLYALKWILDPAAGREEARHPVQCCFIGLIGVATMLVSLAVLPYSLAAARGLFLLGAAFTGVFAVWRTGGLWRGDREEAATTPVLYLPSVAGCFVMATAAVAMGYAEWGRFAFGAGLFAWLAIESVLLRRFYSGPPLPPALRPTLGIQLAPPVVGAVAYLSVNGGQADLIAYALVGYGLLQALILIRLSRWILEQPFAPSYWAFTFGATALATASLRLAQKSGDDVLAAVVFVAANLLIGAIALRTVYGAARRLISARPGPAAPKV